MQKSILLDVNAEPELVFDVLSDLKNYPLWLSFIQKVENTDIHESWMVTLRSQIGPFSRLKKLRMRRTYPHQGVASYSIEMRLMARTIQIGFSA